LSIVAYGGLDSRLDNRLRALKGQIEDLIALQREDASPAQLARVYATCVTAYRAANLRAMVVAQVPYRVVDKRTRQPVDNHPLNALFRDNPGFQDLMERSELAMCFWGHNLIFKQRVLNQRIVALRWINPRIYRARTDFHHGLLGFDLAMTDRDGLPRRIARHDGVYMHKVDFDDDFDGVAPAEVAFDQAGIETEAALTAVWFLRNRAIPGGIVQPKDENETFDTQTRGVLRDMLRQIVKGARNAGKTIVPSHRLEWIQMQQQFDQIGMEPLTDTSREGIAMAFDVPLDLLIPSAATYAAVFQSDDSWGRYFVKGRCRWYAGQFTEQVAREYDDDVMLEPAFDEVFDDDEQQQTDLAIAQKDGGLISVYDAQVKVGNEAADDRLKQVYVLNGQPLTVDRILELAQSGSTWPPAATLGGGLALPNLPSLLPPQPGSDGAGDTATPSGTPPQPAGQPAPADAAPSNLSSTDGLNGAQIDAALQILSDLRTGVISQVVALELLIALGVEPSRAQRMVDETAPSGNGFQMDGSQAAARGHHHYHPDGDDAPPLSGNGFQIDDDPDDPDWLPDAVFKELRDCARIVEREGPAYAFAARALTPDVVAYVRLLAATGGAADETLAAARAYWRGTADLRAMRAYADVEQAYRAALYDLIRKAFSRQVGRGEFGDLGRAEISAAFNGAFREGLRDTGVAVEKLEGAEAAFVHEQALAERRYWTRLADSVYAELLPLDQQIKDRQAEARQITDPSLREQAKADILQMKRDLIAARDAFLKRLDLWAQGLRRIYSQGQMSGERNPLLLYTNDPSKENCRSCIAADGQIHRASEWSELGIYPGSGALECVASARGVPVCGCGFSVTQEKPRGNLKAIPLFGAARSLPHAAKSSYGTPSGTVILTLTGIDGIVTAQDTLIAERDALDNSRWTPPVGFHVTLVHAELVDEDLFAAIFEAVRDQVTAFDLHAATLDVFDQGDYRALVLLIDATDDLRALQRAVYDAFRERDVAVSDTSDPAQWRPHITLGYEESQVDFDPRDVDVTARTSSLVFSRGDYAVIHESQPVEVRP